MKRALILCLGLLAACGPPEYPGIDRSEEDAFRATWESARLEVRLAEEQDGIDADVYEWTMTHEEERVDLSEGEWEVQQADYERCNFTMKGHIRPPLYTDDDLRTSQGRINVGYDVFTQDRRDSLAENCELRVCYMPRMRLEDREGDSPPRIELDPICALLYEPSY